MRFIEGGPVIPDNVLLARDEGRVMFFCGAGVSRAKAGLDDFYGLADCVLNKLHVSADHTTRKVLAEAREIGNRTGASGLISADRIFGLLEREFVEKDIEAAVANALKPNENVDLSAHQIMLDLATTTEGKVKLVTTNFDRLFEASLKQAGVNDTKIKQPHHLPDLARVGEFDAIVHLHGIVSENYDSAEGDGFILTSSEFGRAYLTEGWATTFFKEILSQYVVVFVGYGAEDPPVQYLLEALNKRKGQLSEVYAFQDGTEHEAIGQWIHKGVEAIAYNNTDDYKALWDTLSLWAKRAKSPQNWHQEVINLAKQRPDALKPFQRGQVAHVVSTLEGVRKLYEGDRFLSAEWLCVFDPWQRYALPGKIWKNYIPDEFIDPFYLYGLDSDETPQHIDPENHNKNRETPDSAWNAFTLSKQDRQNLQDHNLPAFRGDWSINSADLPPRLYHLGVWLSKVADQPAAVWWAAKQRGIHPGIQHSIQREVIHGSKPVEPVIRQAWCYLFEYWDQKIPEYHRFSLDWHDLETIVKREGWTDQNLRKYGTLKHPFFQITQNSWSKQKPPVCSGIPSLTDMLNIEVEYPKQVHEIQIPDEWLESSIRVLRQNLEYGLQLENEIHGGSLLRFIGSILPDDRSNIDRHSRTKGLYGEVICFFQLFERLVELDSAAAQRELLFWQANDQGIFDHLHICVAGKSEVVSDQSFVSIMLGLGDEIFWGSYTQRDLLLVLSKRWNQLPENLKLKLETRLLSGPSCLENETDQEFKERNAWVTLNRLHWLAEHDCNFKFNLSVERKRLQLFVPDWVPDYAKKAGESMGSRSGIVSHNEDCSALLTEGLDTILSRSVELGGRSEDFLIENAPFTGLCKAKPIRSFSTLTHHAKCGEFPKWAWKRFFYSPKREDDKPKFSALIAERIVSYPSEKLIDIIYPVTQWLNKSAEIFADKFNSTYSRIVDKLIKVIELQPSIIRSSLIRGGKKADWNAEAINSSVGHIVQILLSDYRLNQLNKGEKLPEDWVRQVERLLVLPDDLHRYALVILARQLNWLFYRDQNWVEKNLLSVLKANSSADKEAFWGSFLWACKMPNQSLYMRLKPYLLNLASADKLSNSELGQTLSGIILSGWGSAQEGTNECCVSDSELHDVILNTDDEFRCHLIWNLEHFCIEEVTWQKQLSELFGNVWPKQKSVKTPRVSSALFDLVFSKAECFNEVAEIILPLLTSTKQSYLHGSSIEGILDLYPKRSLAIIYKVFIDLSSSDWPYNLEQELERIAIANNSLRADPRWLELKRKLNGL